MAGALKRIKEEIRKVLGTALFFSLAFCLIVLTNKLLVHGSNIEIASFAKAIIGGLIIAKVLLIVDLFPFVDLFPGKALIYNITWKTLIYGSASLVYRYLDLLIPFLFKGGSMVAAHDYAMQEFAEPKFWATEIWIVILFAIFVTLKELSRALGKNKLRLIFLGGGLNL